MYPYYRNVSIDILPEVPYRLEDQWNGGYGVINPQYTDIIPLSPPEFVTNMTGVYPIPANIVFEPQALLLQTGNSEEAR